MGYKENNDMQQKKYKEANLKMGEAFRSNSFTEIRSALKVRDADMNFKDPSREEMTPLMKLCYTEIGSKHRRELARLIIEQPKMDINTQDEKGRTALAHACILELDDLVRVFSEHIDIDPNIADDAGNTPLMYATRSGNISVVVALLNCFRKFGLEVDQANDLGETPLLEAAKNGDNNICRHLVTIGKADLTARDKVNYGTAQEYAMESGRCHTPDILMLSPVAQRKTKLRRAREARGKKILSDYVTETRHYNHQVSEIHMPLESCPKKDFGFFVVSKNGLSAEEMQAKRSLSFQVGRHLMERLTEKPDLEKREEQEMDEYLTMKVQSSSLPNLADLNHGYEKWKRGESPLSKSFPCGAPVEQCDYSRPRAWTTGNVILPPVKTTSTKPGSPRPATRISTSPKTIGHSSSPDSQRQRRTGVVSKYANTPCSGTPRSPTGGPRLTSPGTSPPRPMRKISLPSRLPCMPSGAKTTTPPSAPPPRQRKISAPSMLPKRMHKNPPNAIPSYIYKEW
ncbi:uncharacterized protein LOC100374675 [Saccoglossus kowalevskii]|uniref:POTE ankyrin domain family member C-like n=1 Tax=Saccoglossus kowalevskii TaxID=10224 RepID=A0ABM0GPB6_SACKO|nr:PREDICTED: POTE ankyrin domain family member C-like [Saccoglossus kowalevskii]